MMVNLLNVIQADSANGLRAIESVV